MTVLQLIRYHTSTSDHKRNILIATLLVITYFGVGVALFFLWATVVLPNVNNIGYTTSIIFAIVAKSCHHSVVHPTSI